MIVQVTGSSPVMFLLKAVHVAQLVRAGVSQTLVDLHFHLCLNRYVANANKFTSVLES